MKKCEICKTKIAETRLISKNNFEINVSNYIESCISCLPVLNEKDKSCLLLLPGGVIKLKRYLNPNTSESIFDFICDIPDITENVESELYRFNAFLAIYDEFGFQVIVSDFNEYQKNGTELDTRHSKYESVAPKYVAIYNSLESKVTNIYKINSDENVESLSNINGKLLFSSTSKQIEVNCELSNVSSQILGISQLRAFPISNSEFFIIPEKK